MATAALLGENTGVTFKICGILWGCTAGELRKVQYLAALHILSSIEELSKAIPTDSHQALCNPQVEVWAQLKWWQLARLTPA